MHFELDGDMPAIQYSHWTAAALALFVPQEQDTRNALNCD